MWFQTYLAYCQLVFTIVDKMGKKEYASSTTLNELRVLKDLRAPTTHRDFSSSSWSFCWSGPPCYQRLLPPRSVWSSCSYHHEVTTAWRATGSCWRAWSSFQLCKSHGWGPQHRWFHICLQIKINYKFTFPIILLKLSIHLTYDTKLEQWKRRKLTTNNQVTMVYPDMWFQTQLA